MIEDISIDSDVVRISNIDKYITRKTRDKSCFLKTGFDIGYSNLDMYLGGLEIGNNVVIGARPSVGKTALALELTQRLFKYNPDKEIIVIFFNWEMGNEQLYYRMLCNKLNTNILDLKKNYIKYKQTTEFKKAQEEINKMNMFLIETYNEISDLYIFIKNVRERFYNENRDVKIVCIYDHSRLVVTKDRTTEEQRIFELFKVCNQIKKMGILNIILSQLNRDYEKNLHSKYQDPNNTYLFGADAIQQFSDVTLLLHSPHHYKCYEWECINSEYQNVNINTENKLFINVSKNRNGMNGFNLCIEYIKETQTFNCVKYKVNNNSLFKDEE